MKTTDLFKVNRSSKRINESIEKIFGQKLNLESFDLPRLEDARNKLRTQLSQVRGESGFNENLENDAYHKAQWMLDAINAEIAERQEFIVDPSQSTISEEDTPEFDIDDLFDQWMNSEYAPMDDESGDFRTLFDKALEFVGDIVGPEYAEMVAEKLADEFNGEDYGDKGGETDDNYAMTSAGFGSDEDYGHYGESAPPTAKGERMVKHIKKGYAKDGKLSDKERSIAYATAWKQHNKEKTDEDLQDKETVDDFLARGGKIQQGKPQKGPKKPGLSFGSKHIGTAGGAGKASNISGKGVKPRTHKPVVGETNEQGEVMTKLREGEIQSAQSIVTAKTMVDRVGRWIEELAGMENDTLLQLGDQIRDEKGQDMAKQFISTVAPAVQQALENLKSARETLAGGVRMLTGEEQPEAMLGSEPKGDLGDEFGPAEPDMMNPEDEGDMGDAFGAAEPATGGIESAGREQRESIDRQNQLLKVLAG